MKSVLPLLLVSLAASASADPQSGDPGPRKYVIEKRASEIDPRARPHPEINFVFTDEKGRAKDLQHAVVDTRVAPQGKLVIWLMSYRKELFDRTSSYGLHSIQVHYANGWFSKISKQVGKGTGLGGVRLEAATGEDHSPLVEIPKPDGMQERALQFVKWLVDANPEGKWDQFIEDDGLSLNWDKVIMAGASHGSTTAARFAKHQKVDRVVMLCGPRDQYETWQSLPSATPAGRYFGFSHILDGGWAADHYCRSWQMLGLHEFGPIVNVDQIAPPYKNSRRLITDTDVNMDPKRAHSMVTPGGSSAKDDEGNLLHEPVWRYLFTHPVNDFGEAELKDPGCLMDQK
ncbi:MAG: BPSS1187 family protein [Verrucomicrobiales bacterium]